MEDLASACSGGSDIDGDYVDVEAEAEEDVEVEVEVERDAEDGGDEVNEADGENASQEAMDVGMSGIDRVKKKKKSGTKKERARELRKAVSAIGGKRKILDCSDLDSDESSRTSNPTLYDPFFFAFCSYLMHPTG